MTTAAPVVSAVLVGPEGNRALVRLQGEIDCATAWQLREELAAAARGRHDVVLDLSEVTFLDAAGLGVFVELAGRLRAVGGLELRSASELVYRMCVVTHLTELLHVERMPAGRAVPPTAGRPEEAESSPGRTYSGPGRAGGAARAGGVSVALHRLGRLRTVAATDAAALDLDHDQYDCNEGPGVDAAASGRPVFVSCLSDEQSWPAFSTNARARGVQAVLSLPLFDADRPVGALTVYAAVRAALVPGSVGWAESLASEASLLVTLADFGGIDTSGEPEMLDALRSRETIAQAQGVLIGRVGTSAEGAQAALRNMSRRTGRPLRDIAADCLASVTQSASSSAGAPGPAAAPVPRSVPAPAGAAPGRAAQERARRGGRADRAEGTASARAAAVSPRQPDGTVYLHARGAGTTEPTARCVREMFDRAYRRRATLVVADLSGLGVLDEAALDALVAGLRRLSSTGCVVELQNVPRQLRWLRDEVGAGHAGTGAGLAVQEKAADGAPAV